MVAISATVVGNKGKGCGFDPKSGGFTMMELLVTLAVAGILFILALPNLRSFLLSQEVKTTASDIHMSLLYARSEAVKRNANVDVVPRLAWQDGWNVQFGAAPATVLKTMDYHVGMTITGPASVTYGRDGRLVGMVNKFSVSAAEDASILMRCISIAPSGLPRVDMDRDGDPSNGCT